VEGIPKNTKSEFEQLLTKVPVCQKIIRGTFCFIDTRLGSYTICKRKKTMKKIATEIDRKINNARLPEGALLFYKHNSTTKIDNDYVKMIAEDCHILHIEYAKG
jgi:hypothetical protein